MVGFYDRRCMLTGLSLHGIDATLVPLYPDQDDQHYGEDVRAYFDEAMRDYADVPAVRAALDGYARDELPA